MFKPILTICFNCNKLHMFPRLVLIMVGFNLSCLNKPLKFVHQTSLIGNCEDQ